MTAPRDSPPDGETLLARMIAGSIGDAEVEEATRRLAPLYRRPQFLGATLDDYADWEERARPLSRALSECLQAVYREIETDPPAALRRALALQTVSRVLPSRNPEVITFAVGYTLLKNDRFFDAIGPFREVAAASRGTGAADELIVLRSLIDALRNAKEVGEALKTLDEAITLASEGGLRGSHAALMLERGEILSETGNEVDALKCLTLTVDEVRTLTPDEIREQSPPSLGASLMSLGTARRKFGRFEDAIKAFREAAEAEKRAGYLPGYSWGLSEIGYTYSTAGESARAIEYLELAAKAGREAGDTFNAARWQRQVDTARGERTDDVFAVPLDDTIEAKTAAEAYNYSTLAEQAALEGRYDDAQRAAQVALRWAELRNDYDLEIASLTVLGKIHSDREQLDEACELTWRAIEIAYRTNNRAVELRLRGNLANALLRKEDYQKAVDVLIEGIATAKHLVAATEASEIRQSIMSEAMHLYEMYALLLSHTEDYQRLLAITEQARARNLTGWIEAESRLERVTEPVAGTSAGTALRDLRAAEVELEVRHQSKDLDSAEVEPVLTRRNAAREHLEDALRATGAPLLPWQEGNTDLAAVESAVEALVHRQSGVLCLFSVSEGVCPVFATRDDDGVRYRGTFIPSDRQERRAAIAAWTTALAMDAGSDEVDALLAAFRPAVFDPIERLVNETAIERLAVIPHADLSLLPYWELLDRCASLQSLTIAPSVGVLRLCDMRRRAARGTTLLLTDPTGTLPSVEFEADLIRDARSDGAVVNPSTIREIEETAPECTLFHAATHGLFFPERPYHSGLAATAERKASQDRFTQFVDRNLEPVAAPVDGGARLLTVAEIMARLSLRECRLAVLSACQSGLPRLHGGGEMTGLPSSFLVAGARSVVASLWPVEDAATALLMESFYDEWEGGRGSESSPARALCRARARLRKMTRTEAIARLGSAADVPHGARPFDHPFYSDAFTCFGAW